MNEKIQFDIEGVIDTICTELGMPRAVFGHLLQYEMPTQYKYMADIEKMLKETNGVIPVNSLQVFVSQFWKRFYRLDESYTNIIGIAYNQDLDAFTPIYPEVEGQYLGRLPKITGVPDDKKEKYHLKELKRFRDVAISFYTENQQQDQKLYQDLLDREDLRKEVIGGYVRMLQEVNPNVTIKRTLN